MDSFCLIECIVELGECQKECNDRYLEVMFVVDVVNIVNVVKVEFFLGIVINIVQLGSYSFYVD